MLMSVTTGGGDAAIFFENYLEPTALSPTLAIPI
jgi:hypothetical protein